MIEADESGVPLIVLTADRPPELRGTGANQTIDQLKLYGGAVRWFCEAGLPEARAGMVGYWRSLACRAWAQASGAAGGLPGPVHVNVPLREPLVPGRGPGPDGWPEPLGGWPEPLSGRPGGAPWTASAARPGPASPPAPAAIPGRARPARRRVPGLPGLEIDWTERGVVVCGDGDEATPGRCSGWPSWRAGRCWRSLVIGRPARPERAIGVPVPAGDARVRGRAPARCDHLGRAAGPFPRPARVPAGRAGRAGGPAHRARAAARATGPIPLAARPR